MAFSISNASTDGILLDRKMIVFPAQLFILIGVILLVSGILPLMFLSSVDPVFRAIMPLLSLIGIVAIITGIRYPIDQKRSIPDSLYFDNVHGRIRIYHSYSETPEAFIYYPEIKGFFMDQIQETKSRNRYVVLLKKVDGGEWDLYHSRSYSSADKVLKILRNKVNISTPAQRVETAGLPVSKVRVEQNENSLNISWSNNLTQNILSMMIWISAVVLATVYAFNYIFILDGRSTFFFETAIFALFVVISGFNFYNLYKSASVIHSIQVTDESIIVSDKTRKGKPISEQNLRFPEIFSIYYKFNSANPEAKLYFVKQSDEQQRREVLALGAEKVAARQDFFKNQSAVNFKDLTTLEVLSIESYIQDFVRSRNRIEIL